MTVSTGVEPSLRVSVAEVGDGPGLGEIGSAAAEAEGEEALVLGLIGSGVEDGELVGAGVEDPELRVFVVEEFGEGGQDLCSHLRLRSVFDEVDGAVLGGGLADDALVDVPAEVCLGGFEARAGDVHLMEDVVEVAGLCLRVRREGESCGGEEKRGGEAADGGHAGAPLVLDARSRLTLRRWHTPEAKAPILWLMKRPKARALGYLDANCNWQRQLAEDPGVVGDDLAVDVEDGLEVIDGDFAGDGFDDAEDGGAAIFVGGGSAHVVGADLVEEADAVAAAAGLFDEDFAGAERDGLDGLVSEVDVVRRDEHEGEDERHHDVVVEAAAFVGPEDVAAD